MKPTKDSTELTGSSLYQFNAKQIEINRKEAAEVKSCFTSQAHHTLIASATILSIGLSLMNDTQMNYTSLAIATVLILMLCQTSIHVGCHKYNTANRTTAFQIHLSRIIDYDENNNANTKLATELRRIDWEEAMFAWRIVQPIIFDYFYKHIYKLGVCLKRFNLPEIFIGKKYKDKITEIKNYPWYDSREILRSAKKPDQNSVLPTFYPGTYLKRMLFKLYAVSAISLLICCYSVNKIYAFNGDSSILFYFYAGVISLVTIITSLNSWWRSGILESGLLSIQTSAFVWRIVCISHLKAKIYSIQWNKSANANSSQIYNGYTKQLAEIACTELFSNLSKIHEWLNEQEKFIIESISKKNKRNLIA